MKTEPFDTRWTAIAAGWLNDENNWKWLQNGSDRSRLDPVTFRLMTQRPAYNFHLFFAGLKSEPIGLVALGDIDLTAKHATIWFVLGNKSYAGKGHTTRAVNECLHHGFGELGLRSIYAWTVPENAASVKILRRNNFNYIGRRRQCHFADGVMYDRFLFDILSSEYVKYSASRKKSPLHIPVKSNAQPTGKSLV